MSFFGVPHDLASDKGSHFDDEMVRTYCRDLGISYRATTAHHHQAMGHVERANRTIVEAIRTTLMTARSQWLLLLRDLQLHLNATVNRSLGYSPLELMLGIKPRTPLASASTLPTTPLLSAPEVADRRADIWRRALGNQDKAREANKESYDAKRTPVTYKAGDLVLVRNEHMRSKLDTPWLGPSRVKGAAGHDTYDIEDYPVSTGSSKKVHIDRMRCFDASRSTSHQILQAQLADGYYLVERVVKHDRQNGRLRFFIKWRDWDDQANTWEPYENVSKIEVVQAYMKRLGLSPR